MPGQETRPHAAGKARQCAGEHNALNDARWNKEFFNACQVAKGSQAEQETT